MRFCSSKRLPLLNSLKAVRARVRSIQTLIMFALLLGCATAPITLLSFRKLHSLRVELPLQGSVSSIQTVMASALVLGCATASITLWYFSRRYVGEMSLLQGGPGRPSRLCFSVMDFWGHREVNSCHSLLRQMLNALLCRFQQGISGLWRPQPAARKPAGILGSHEVGCHNLHGGCI